jgi:gluconokinase
MASRAERSAPLVLSIDIGTSSARVTAFDLAARRQPGFSTSETHQLHTTPDGGAELDADELVERVLRLLEGVCAQIPADVRVSGVGCCTFWHSVLGVDAAGNAVTPIYTWADTRSTAAEAALRERLDEAAVHARTGCRFHTSYLPARLLWLSEAEPEQFRRAARWMSPAEYLYSRLFGAPYCSVSMASGTGLLDQEQMAWDAELLAALPIEADQLSPIVPLADRAVGLSGDAAARLPRLRGTPWVPAIGDGAASNIGSGCVSPDRVALMVGTSGAMRALVDGGSVKPPPGLWEYRVDADRPLVGGALSNGGNLLAWLAETLRLPDLKEVEREVAVMAPDLHGLTFLPFLAGERSVGWRADARAAIVGLSWSTRREEIVRAALECVALRFAEIWRRLAPLVPDGRAIIASGGALLASPVWAQIVADALNEPVIASGEPEASSRGAALLALESLGLCRLADIDFPFGPRYEPDATRHARYREALARQQRLYDLLLVQSDLGTRRGR